MGAVEGQPSVTDQPREQPKQPKQRSISPRQKSPRTPKMADARTSRMSEAVNTLRGGSQLSQEGAKDCGHFLCQRVGGVCVQEGGEQQGGGGGLRPGFQASNTGHQAANTDYHKLPCSPQMQTVVWRASQSAEQATTTTAREPGSH